MDPPLVNEASFTAGSNLSSYSLVDLLSLPITASFAGDEESTLTDHSGAAAKRRRPYSDRNSSGDVSTSQNQHELLLSESSGGKRAKAVGSGDEMQKTEPPKDYIHVRARRGQATDSHSLAERARRERISERMKILQDLVPGCNKVIGKAMVLDEIINYIQSLQGQVEFLSMKLEAVNSSHSRTTHSIEGFPLKDLTARTFDANQMIFGLQTPKENSQGSQAEWLHMQIGNALERAT